MVDTAQKSRLPAREAIRALEALDFSDLRDAEIASAEKAIAALLDLIDEASRTMTDIPQGITKMLEFAIDWESEPGETIRKALAQRTKLRAEGTGHRERVPWYTAGFE